MEKDLYICIGRQNVDVMMNLDWLLLFIVSLCISRQIFGKRDVNRYNTEEQLRSELLANYSAQQKPGITIQITVSLTILTVKELDIKDQALSLAGYLRLEWFDKRLAWDRLNATNDYGDISLLYATERYLWKPTIIIENAIDGLAVISDTTIPMRITKRGRVIWNPVGIYRVSCQSDTRFYPMDTQICYLKISSWAYTSSAVQLFFHKIHAVNTNFYVENGEWELMSVLPYQEQSDLRTEDKFSTLTFSLKLRRRPMFHIGNTLFPVSTMAFLIAVVFKLPVESGEKIGFSLTVLLSYAVYLTVISGDIPSTSNTVCFLSLYIISILFLATVAVFCTTLVINLRMRQNDNKIPEWLKRCMCKYIKRLALIKPCCVCKKDTNSQILDGQKNRNRIHVKRESIILCDIMSNEVMGRESLTLPETDMPTNGEGNCEISWEEIAEIMDKFFFNIFVLLICTSTITFYLIVLIGYLSVGE